jgi:threonine aldolase
LVGGTQTNTIVIDAMLRHNEGILAATSGHINVHEAGAIEACGHKVIPMTANLGKVDIDALEQHMALATAEFNAVGWEHYVIPRALYISLPTELGTLYTLAELRRLRDICEKYNLFLFVDGARLGYGLAAPACDVTLRDLAQLADVCYFGGTKVGALFGEAVVVLNKEIRLTRGLIKHRGAMLAKGWLLGVQFATLMTDGLYWDIARNAVNQALRLRQAMIDKGYQLYIDSPTNQQFFVIDNDRLAVLQQSVGVDIIEPVDATHTIIRLCTSWATTDEQIDHLISFL